MNATDTTKSDQKVGQTEPCKCLEKIRAKLTELHGPGSDVQFALRQTINMKTFEVGTNLPPLDYTFKEGKKTKKSYVPFNYCPFCGTPK